MKGKLHNHDLEIHIQQVESGEVIAHKCIANANQALPNALEYAKEMVRRWNSFPNLLLEALEEIANLETICCPRCEGNGRLWADGKSHLPDEQIDTVFCGNCGGSGRILPEDAQEIASNAIIKFEKGE